jgi:hypothetical protein
VVGLRDKIDIGGRGDDRNRRALVREHCEHGSRFDQCSYSRCREISALLEQPDSDTSGRTVGGYNEALPPPATARVMAPPAASGLTKTFKNGFVINAALAAGALTVEQADIIREICAYQRQHGEPPSFRELARRTGRGDRAVKKTWAAIACRRLHEPPPQHGMVKRVRLRRGPAGSSARRYRYYLVRYLDFAPSCARCPGECSTGGCGAELITSAQFHKLRRAGARVLDDGTCTSYGPSRMRLLLDDLARALSGVPPTGPAHSSTDADWANNLEWARRRVESAGADGSYPSVLLALGTGLPSCRACGTPILSGCKIDGRALNRRDCDQRCKKAAERRRRKPVAPGLRIGTTPDHS